MYIVAKFKHSATTNTMKVAPIYTEPSVKDRLKQFQVTSFYSHGLTSQHEFGVTSLFVGPLPTKLCVVVVQLIN